MEVAGSTSPFLPKASPPPAPVTNLESAGQGKGYSLLSGQLLSTALGKFRFCKTNFLIVFYTEIDNKKMQKLNSESLIAFPHNCVPLIVFPAPGGTGSLTRNRQTHSFWNNLEQLQNKAKSYRQSFRLKVRGIK